MNQSKAVDTPDTRKKGPSINYLVYVLASSLAKGASAYYGRNYGVTLPEMRILSTLRTAGRLSARDITERTAMDKAMVSRVLNKMNDNGLVRLDDEGTAVRLRDWELTEAGRELVQRIAPEWERREAEIQAGLSAREYENLSRALQELIRASEDLRTREAEEFRKG